MASRALVSQVGQTLARKLRIGAPVQEGRPEKNLLHYFSTMEVDSQGFQWTRAEQELVVRRYRGLAPARMVVCFRLSMAPPDPPFATTGVFSAGRRTKKRGCLLASAERPIASPSGEIF